MGPAAAALEGRDGDVIETGCTLRKGVEGKARGLRSHRAGETFAGEHGLHEGTVTQYPLIAPDALGGLSHLRPRSVASREPAPCEVGPLPSREMVFHERVIPLPCRVSAELQEHGACILPGVWRAVHEGGMARVGIDGEIGEPLDDPRPYRIEVDVADELDEVLLFLRQHRLVAILEQLAVAVMSPVEADCLPREEAGHDGVKRDRAGLQQEMRVVAEERPGIAGRARLGENLTHPLDEAIPVDVVPEDQPPFDAAHDDVVKDSGPIEPSVAGHATS